jgi:V-type H+-transporting ATPase subunit D
MTLQTYKGKHKAAVVGFELLKKKADALKSRIQKMIRAIHTLKLSIGDDVKRAHLALAKASYASSGGNFVRRVLENDHKATLKIEGKVENVAGVKIAKYVSVNMQEDSEGSMSSLYGLSGGGAQINKCKEEFTALLEKLIRLATLQAAFKTLDEAMKVTNRRVNALDNVVVPRLANTVHYITQELDELEREDFTRLKKVVSKKQETDEADGADGAGEMDPTLDGGNSGPSALDEYNVEEEDEDLLSF